ncbi:Spx/MgsR family RNA polymerase-binding regulatory protein [Arcticibacterium luteifluviistationis]|uniref:Arsenate reductase n=1 Tax=Arcticibacterium luteifluviistationis TaxID=1784714 RepID=A0A2Z4GIM1_9BACT|nr:Spx/MgsR family RNA polymerase-binding regulatory protein [Arcticibacterium luteifluviistationis]AWW00975.1 arsenate reductase [Arcticibacterium luteifluviistationis]
MAYILYGIPNCNTVKKAQTWLTENGVDFKFHNFKKDGLSKEKVDSWLSQESYEVLINKKGTTYRKLSAGEKDALDNNAAAAELMLANASVIKRPVLELDEKVISVGFTPELYEGIF